MQIAILGLGRFGSELALTLADEGHEVLGIDMDEHEVHHHLHTTYIYNHLFLVLSA